MRTLNVLACLAGALLTGALWAQTTSSEAAAAAQGVHLRAALDAAWLRAVAARQQGGERLKAEADRAAADRTWAAPPSLSFGFRDDRLLSFASKREAELGLALPLWLPGQRAARAGVAQAALDLSQASEQTARLQLAGEVREAYHDGAAVQAELAEADAHLQALQQLASDVERRVSAGDLARADALVAHAERLAVAAQQARVRQRFEAAQARWTWLTGLRWTADTAPASPAVARTSGAEATVSIDAHPELLVAAKAVDLAQQRVALMRVSRRDAPELTLGLRQEFPGSGAASTHSVAIGVRVPLATDSRNHPLEVAALTDLDVAQVRVQRLRERLASDVANARSAQAAAAAQLDAETQRARLLRERAQLIDKSFRAGETPLPELLRTLAAAAQADSAVARQATALAQAAARLEQALGVLP